MHLWQARPSLAAPITPRPLESSVLLWGVKGWVRYVHAIAATVTFTPSIDLHILNFTALSVVGVLQYSLLRLVKFKM